MKSPAAKRILLPIFILMAGLTCAAQEFSTSIIFEDSLSNRDTLVVGYDTNATAGIDSIFLEENIIQQPWDSIFDVRITDRWHSSQTFHTKRQIVSSPCSVPNADDRVVTFNINARHWPVKVYWADDFRQDCLDSTSITNCGDPSYCDVPCSPQIDFFINTFPGEITLEKPEFWEDYCGYAINGDTISYLHLVLSDDGHWVGIKPITQQSFSAYPNPFSNELYLSDIGQAEQIEIADSYGNLVFKTTALSNKIELSFLPDGMYFLEIKNKDSVKTAKIIKSGR